MCKEEAAVLQSRHVDVSFVHNLNTSLVRTSTLPRWAKVMPPLKVINFEIMVQRCIKLYLSSAAPSFCSAVLKIPDFA